jgi:speckle-type POZ protein
VNRTPHVQLNSQVSHLKMASTSLANPSHLMRGPNFQFEVDYYKSKDLPIGTCISSPTFTAGGFDWALDFYPHGDTPEQQGSHVSLLLCLKSKVAKDVTAEYSFTVLDKKGRFISAYPPEVDNFTKGRESWGFENFLTKNEIEKRFIVDGAIFVISCTIKVLTAPTDVQTYPGGLCEQIGKLWEKGHKSDVTFVVEGESICAHRLILAARSPVFEANLFGPMAEAKMGQITIYEMKAEVFKALLRFIYTDQLCSSEQQTLPVELLQGLFVAADRYALDKLRMLCEEQLVRNLSVETVAATLLLADRHSRPELKGKCLNFATAPENFSLVALTEGYLQIMQGAPTLFADLSEKVKCSPSFTKKLAKKKRTC